MGPDSALAFARGEAIDLFEGVLNSLKNSGKNAMVTGPPGSGKSLIAWKLVCYLANEKKYSFGKDGILWIRLFDESPATVSLLKATGIQSIEVKCIDSHCLHHEMVAILDKVQPSLVVLDGVTKTTEQCRKAVANQCKVSKHLFLCVNSMQIRLKEDDRLCLGIEPFQLFAWTEGDLEAAFNKWEFRKSVIDNFKFSSEVAEKLDIDESKLQIDTSTLTHRTNCSHLFEAKFSLAGYSARFMFENTPGDVLRILNGSISSANTAGENSRDAANTLFCSLKSDSYGEEGRIRPTSAYVLRWFLNHDEKAAKFFSQFTVFSRIMANGGLQGLVFELHFRARLVTCTKKKTKIALAKDDGRGDKKWGVKKLVRLESGKSLIDLEDHLIEVGDDVWLIPVNWDHCPSIDFVCVSPSASNGKIIDGIHICVVQLTIAKSHNFNFKDVRKNVLNRLKREKLASSIWDNMTCEVCVVYPTESARPKMTTTCEKSDSSPWKWRQYTFLQMTQNNPPNIFDVASALESL